MDSWDNTYLDSPSVDLWDEFPSDMSPCGSFEEPYYLFTSQPLSRHTSSEGSAIYPLSLPDSPLSANIGSVQSSPLFDSVNIDPALVPANFIPEFSLNPEGQAHSPFPVFPPTPAEIPRTVPFPQRSTSRAQASTRDYPLICLFPNCNAKPFRRRADLERHYRNRHEPDSRREAYRCDYKRCSRKTDPFHRRDHFRDHLRDFHREDIEKRGVTVSEDWYQNRNTPSDWWRCNKCLRRISVEANGFECPNCKSPCHEKRREVRQRLV